MRPARPTGAKDATPVIMMPIWEMVEKASSRFRCRCDQAMMPPYDRGDAAERQEQAMHDR